VGWMYAGIAELPLHGGHVPRWMAEYMKKLARAIVMVIVEEYGPEEVVVRLSDPFWFQAFNNAIGMDWDSSGSTTVTLGILRQVLDEEPSLGVAVAGGKGRLARNTPLELEEKGELISAPSRSIREAIYASRLAAKTDTVLLQDGYTLYHHAVVIASTGRWAVIQQGMNPSIRMARRYHWLSPLPSTPSLEPHSAIAAARREEAVLDATSRKSLEARKTVLDLARQKPEKTIREIAQAVALLRGTRPLFSLLGGGVSERVKIVARYYKPQPRPPRHIGEVLKKAYEAQPRSVEELVLLEGFGPTAMRSLALVSELIYGYPLSHEDPASVPLDPFRYAYIVGGKDGVPFAFNPRLAEKVVSFLEEAIERARLGEKEKLRVLARLRRLLVRGG